jgi:Zn-dependent metalloprotease
MKTKIIIVAISICIGLISCKQDETENRYCVNQIRNSSATIVLSLHQMDTIKLLFDYNHLDYSKYLFYSLQNDELGYHHVRCYQFENNLQVFTNDLIFHFNDKNNYYFLSGYLVGKINLDTSSKMSSDSVVAKYLYALEQDKDYVDDKKEIFNNCFDLEFGYYDLNAGTSNTSKNFTKAWKIKPAKSDYPYAYINDTKSEIISYDNGIRY